MSENLSRAEHRQHKREKQKLQKMTKGLSSLKIVSLALVTIAALVLWYLLRQPALPHNEVEVSIMSSEHIANTDDVVYNSNPPTSGPHFSDWKKEWKFYESELPTSGLIHNMEHGGIVVFYKSTLDEASKAELKEFTEDNFKVIASVKEDIPAPIALSAWGVYELFDMFDEAGMKRFYEANLNNAPENVYP